jgi:ubiquinone/menaquinone biosynthesis C-methylase UbiE
MKQGEQEAALLEGTPEEKAALRRYWDTHPISTDSVPYQPGTRESFEAIYEKWRATIDQMRLEFLASCRGRKVLEVGCGIGKDARFLTENGIDYTGIDYSFRTLQLAKQHFDYAGLPKRFTNADATVLPFADNTFGLAMSIGVIHHIPGTREAARELVRVTAPGGIVRVMFYNRHSYHYALVNWVVRPLIWLILRVRPLKALLSLLPSKFRNLYDICEQDGFSRERILATSADTSFAGQDNFIPRSGFWTEAEMRTLFAGLEEFSFIRRDLKYFPLPFLRGWTERRCGFFLTMIARKPLGNDETAVTGPLASGFQRPMEQAQVREWSKTAKSVDPSEHP